MKTAKPPTEPRPFLFDNAFDVASKPAKKPKPEEEKPPEPTFNLEQLEEARQQGYEQGRLAGARDAASGTESEIARLVADIAASLPAVAAAQTEANGRLMRDGATLAAAIMGKILPSTVARHGMEEIDALLTQCLRTLIDQPKIVVRVAPRHTAALGTHLAAAAAAAGFDGRFMVEADESMEPSDCRISWQGGGLERKAADIWHQVESAVNQYLARGEGGGADDHRHSPGEPLDSSEER